MENNNAELEALRSKAIDYCSKGDFDKAVDIHKDIITKYKDSDEACANSYASIGDIYLTLRKLELAEDYLRKALGYDPLDSKCHYLLGFTYSVSSQWDRAIKEFELSVKQEPDEPEYLRGLGWALCSSGKKAEGLKYLGRAISLAPDNENILTDLAVVYLKNGDPDKAREYAERAVKINPESALAREVLHNILRIMGGLRTIRRSTSEKHFGIYQMKVKLVGSEPAIWRSFRVSGNITLYKLHRILQVVMGWDNYHLYEFRVGKTRYGEPDPEWGMEIKSARRVRVGEIFTMVRAKFIYFYDFGDGWQHEIVIEDILPTKQELKHPVCIKGKRACPPEDCGGIGGYADLLRIIRNPRDEEYQRMMTWLGGEFDPEYFDLDNVNRGLRRIR